MNNQKLLRKNITLIDKYNGLKAISENKKTAVQLALELGVRWHQHEPLSLGMRLAQVENKAKFVVPFFQYWK